MPLKILLDKFNQSAMLLSWTSPKAISSPQLKYRVFIDWTSKTDGQSRTQQFYEGTATQSWLKMGTLPRLDRIHGFAYAISTSPPRSGTFVSHKPAQTTSVAPDTTKRPSYVKTTSSSRSGTFVSHKPAQTTSVAPDTTKRPSYVKTTSPPRSGTFASHKATQTTSVTSDTAKRPYRGLGTTGSFTTPGIVSTTPSKPKSRLVMR